MATEESTKELGKVSPKNPNAAGRKGRHKPGLEQESSLRMALFTCITTRQLKVVLDLCDELVNPAKQEYCILDAVSNEAAGLMTSMHDATDIDVSEGQRESSLLHVIHLREGTTSTWEEALLRGNRAVFEPIIHGSAQTELTTNAARSNKRSPQMTALEQMEPNSLSSLSGESVESLDVDHLHSVQQSTVFEPACTPSIGLVDSTTLSNVLNDEDNLGKPLSSQHNPAQFGNMECVSVPDIRFEAGKFICDGRIVSSEQQGSVPTSMLFKHRLPKPDRPPPIKKFLSEAKVVSALHSLANGSSPIQTHGASSRSEEIPPKTKCGFRLDGNREYRVPRGGLNSMKRGESSMMQTGPIDLERIERIIQSAEDLLRRRKATIEAEAKRQNDRGTDSLQPPQMNAKHSPDSFYWLTDVDMDKLAVNCDASGSQ